MRDKTPTPNENNYTTRDTIHSFYNLCAYNKGNYYTIDGCLEPNMRNC